MEPVYELYTNEIAAKGIGYLAIRRCGSQELEDTVARGRAALLAAGASELFVCSSDPASPLEEGTWGDYRLEFARDLLWMERELSPLPAARGTLSLEKLTRSRGGLWLGLHNQCFFDMPNSATYGPAELDRALSEACRCGFALVDGDPVGVYELGLTGGTPEIEGIALCRDFRGRGLGRALLAAAMGELAGLGFERCRLTVATDNPVAFGLYRAVGFKAAGIRSRWFKLLAP